MNKSTVYLDDIAHNKRVTADLYDEVSPEILAKYTATWPAAMQAHCAGRAWPAKPQDRHWDWTEKFDADREQPGMHSFAILCHGELQGLLRLNDTEFGRLPEQAGKPLVYIENVATAPWNRHDAKPRQRYGGVGTIFMAAAIQLSMDMNYDGRIGLHSLPDAEPFYRHCGMTAVRRDPGKHQNLLYFEMTKQQAQALLNRMRIG